MKIIFQNTIDNNQNFYDLCEKHFASLIVLFNEEVFSSIKTGSVVLHFRDGKLEVVDKITRMKVERT